MSKALQYKGYFGSVEFDYEDHCFYGDVINIRDVIAFEGNSVDEIEDSFRQAVDAYRELLGRGSAAEPSPTPRRRSPASGNRSG